MEETMGEVYRPHFPLDLYIHFSAMISWDFIGIA